MNYMYQGYQPFQTGNGYPQQVQQSAGLVSVRGINEARTYPVAPGNSVTFKDETAPYVYTKTMGFSQLDRPTFEVFRLVKEDLNEEPEQKHEPSLRKEVDALKAEVARIKSLLNKEDADEYSTVNADSKTDVE